MSFKDHPDHKIIEQLADEEIQQTGRPLDEQSAAILRNFMAEQGQSMRDADRTTLGNTAVQAIVEKPEDAMAVNSGYENGRRA